MRYSLPVVTVIVSSILLNHFQPRCRRRRLAQRREGTLSERESGTRMVSDRERGMENSVARTGKQVPCS